MKRFKVVILAVCVLAMMCSKATYAQVSIEKIEDDNKAQSSGGTDNGGNGSGDFLEDPITILPPTTASYPTFYTADIDLPTTGGFASFYTNKHYYDPNLCWGYPVSMCLGMHTNGICDFTACIWAREYTTNNCYDLSGSSYQTTDLILRRTFPDYPNITLHGVSVANGNVSYASVWDDEDYGEYYNEKKGVLAIEEYKRRNKIE